MYTFCQCWFLGSIPCLNASFTLHDALSQTCLFRFALCPPIVSLMLMLHHSITLHQDFAIYTRNLRFSILSFLTLAAYTCTGQGRLTHAATINMPSIQWCTEALLLICTQGQQGWSFTMINYDLSRWRIHLKNRLSKQGKESHIKYLLTCKSSLLKWAL